MGKHMTTTMNLGNSTSKLKEIIEPNGSSLLMHLFDTTFVLLKGGQRGTSFPWFVFQGITTALVYKRVFFEDQLT